MRVTAKDIERWAERREAQGELPRLVRGLAMQARSITEIAFPAGDSVSRPGWDGQLTSKEGDAWVPAGRSLWELSVRRDVPTKANDDYTKRTESTPEETRIASTLVVVTARHWEKKDTWAGRTRAEGKWRNVIAYDADDLEAWLEANPAIALSFAEDIGIAGDGVETVTHHWQHWASQCQPLISPRASPTLRSTFRAHCCIADQTWPLRRQSRIGATTMQAPSSGRLETRCAECALPRPIG